MRVGSSSSRLTKVCRSAIRTWSSPRRRITRRCAWSRRSVRPSRQWCGKNARLQSQHGQEQRTSKQIARPRVCRHPAARRSRPPSPAGKRSTTTGSG
eukprot:36649-Prymnesium_polylepis.1